MFNGTNIAGATGTSLVLTNAQLADAGVYSVLVTNLYGSAVSSNAVLAVNLPGPPTISLQPTNQTVLAGGNAAFCVTSSGFLPLHYQWIFNGTNLLGGQTNALLILTNVQLSQAGNYAVVVANAYDSVTSSNAVRASAIGSGQLVACRRQWR
jgi:hypothetical protein